MAPPLFAVVEISDNPMLLLVAGVFLLTFVGVCVVAYVVLAKLRRDGAGTGWRLDYNARLPVSQESFERLAHATRSAVKPPEITPAVRENLRGLQSARGALVSVYRTVLISVGLAGLVGGALLLRSHTGANMNALPGGIIVLLSLGALMSGIVPSRTVEPIEPLAPELLRQMRAKIDGQVSRPEAFEVRLGTSEVKRITDMVRTGASMADALRAVYPTYDTLSDSEQRWLQSCVAKLVQER